MEEKQEFKKRNPAVEREISDISESDSRVAVIGKVVSIDSGAFLATIQDHTARMTLLFPKDEMLKQVKVGQIVRVIGVPIGHETGFELKAEIIQDFSGFDMALYQRYMALKGKMF